VLDKLKHWLAGDGLQVRAKARSSAVRRPRPEPPVRAQERACPHCGEPMLAAWGTTCGACRPGLTAPTSADLSTVVRPGEDPARALALGWLVVVQSPDEKRQGTLIALTAPVSVLSRGVRSIPGQEWFDFADEFMSNGHALVSRPDRDEREQSFVIRDRQEPGPSANGTFVNARRLAGESVSLSEGDVIRVGITTLVFKSLWLPPGDPRPA
jgi:hypothetical protein